jgi:hypothetical protein
MSAESIHNNEKNNREISFSGITNTEVQVGLNINKNNIVSYCRTKNPEKDKNFIQCMLGLYDMEDEINGIAPYRLRNIGILPDLNKIDSPSIYMMEKCWDDMPMAEFYTQYDEFVRTQRSPFFFQSNLINMARTLLCYHRQCLDTYYRQGKKAVFNNNKRTNSVRNGVHRGFEENKDMLVNVLCKAYDTFNYKDILAIYRAYVEFYGKHISPHISASLMSAEYPNLVVSTRTSVSKQKSHLESIRDLFDYFESTTGIYLYLSFNTAADWRYARFLGTKIIVSDLTYKCTHGLFCNVLETILHDFNGHLVGQRMIVIDDVYFKDLIQRIQITFPEDYKFYLHMLHQAGHERRLIEFGKAEIQNYCESSISTNNNHIISYMEQLKQYVEGIDVETMSNRQRKYKENMEKEIKKSEKEIGLYETFLKFLEINNRSKGGSRRKKNIKRQEHIPNRNRTTVKRNGGYRHKRTHSKCKTHRRR